MFNFYLTVYGTQKICLFNFVAEVKKVKYDAIWDEKNHVINCFAVCY